ncbi:class I SAM-dependent methyltransferase [Streptomyces yaanensis]|uniref:Class I SAM-dependent methyltransferase n=1 Tax=Streptomyces yaanensis TaxID=1142239 RepID=A0ABV7SAP6_9ACTN|nr:class I SAM-dependent methyltransferase [Streptomyces sp. CGMCC 4.7035]WNB96738.1 class I SAM-dependent methyltransferase [Streptomyces sp. CGMCC 4.7035]
MAQYALLQDVVNRQIEAAMAVVGTMKKRLRELPLTGSAVATLSRTVSKHRFHGSQGYWERRYAEGGTSGYGSEGALAKFKAQILNAFVKENSVTSVIEFGCGDGRQLELAEYPRYLGIDVSETGLQQAMGRFCGDTTKSFLKYDPRNFKDDARFLSADLSLSLDVIFHLVEDEIYLLHLKNLFAAADRFVILYTSDSNCLDVTEYVPPHVRHRPVTRDIENRFPEWRLRERVKNAYPHSGGDGKLTSFADFYIYEAV